MPNYETASTFVKVIQRKLLASFIRTWCICYLPMQYKALCSIVVGLKGWRQEVAGFRLIAATANFRPQK